MRKLRRADDDGFILVDALIGLVVFAAAATVIYEIGIELLERSNHDLDHLSALTVLHSEAKLLQARGPAALSFLPARDENFSYELLGSVRAETEGAAPVKFSWADLVAVDRRSGKEIAKLTVGFDD